jgi:hypothetical protein
MRYKIFIYSFCTLVFFAWGCKKEPIILKRAKPQIKVGAGRMLQDTVHFVKDTVYILQNNVVIENKKVWIIDAGTLIKIDNNIAIDISETGYLKATGTATEPVVFINNSETRQSGSTPTGANFWKGINMYGTATLQYVRIEFAGADNNTALVLNNQTGKSIFNNIQVSYSATNSYEFRGGDVNAANLISYASSSNDFMFTNGYKGMLQNIIAYRHPYYGNNSFFCGVFVDGPNTSPQISNVSVIGPDVQVGINSNYINIDLISKRAPAALIATNRAKFNIKNTLLAGFKRGVLFIDNREAATALQLNQSALTNSLVQAADTSRLFFIPDNLFPPFTANDFKSFMLQPAFKNQQLLRFGDSKLSDPFNYQVAPSIIPAAGSPLLTGADFTDSIFNKPFFKKVTYRGAIGADNWQQGWVNYTPLQTNYNN